MSVFENSEFDQHEQVRFWYDAASGLRAIIAIHSRARGAAAGGCRAWHYTSDEAALTDVLRLSRGMSYKNAMAGLKLGGGKAVILKGEGEALTPESMQSFGRFVDSFQGSYVTAEDVGMSVEWMQTVASVTPYVAGLPPKEGEAGGDPSPKTAYGTFRGMEAAVRHRLGRESLQGLRVAVQGVGNVGFHLCRYLHEAGCSLVVADVNEARLDDAAREFDATIASLDSILFQDVDVVSPCALGAILSAESIPAIQAKVIAGAANNQLATDADGRLLVERGILYCPDYVINAGGIINVACEYEGNFTNSDVVSLVEKIGPRLSEIFRVSEERGQPTNEVADAMARSLIGGS